MVTGQSRSHGCVLSANLVSHLRTCSDFGLSVAFRGLEGIVKHMPGAFIAGHCWQSRSQKMDTCRCLYGCWHNSLSCATLITLPGFAHIHTLLLSERAVFVWQPLRISPHVHINQHSIPVGTSACVPSAFSSLCSKLSYLLSVGY